MNKGMKNHLLKYTTIICVWCMAAGIIICIIKVALFAGQWSYVFGFGLSLLIILAAVEVVERSRE